MFIFPVASAPSGDLLVTMHQRDFCYSSLSQPALRGKQVSYQLALPLGLHPSEVKGSLCITTSFTDFGADSEACLQPDEPYSSSKA